VGGRYIASRAVVGPQPVSPDWAKWAASFSSLPWDLLSLFFSCDGLLFSLFAHVFSFFLHSTTTPLIHNKFRDFKLFQFKFYTKICILIMNPIE
jgi:hypothetical protein